MKGRSKLEKKKISCKNSMWDLCEFYRSTSRVPFQPILFHDYVLTLGNNVKWNTENLCGCNSSLKNKKIRIILPWSPQHERVWCSTTLASVQSSWEVNCNSPPGIQPSPPVSPTPLLLRAEVSQMQPQSLQDADIHKPVLPLFSTSTFPTCFLNFRLGPDISRLDKSLLWWTN